LASLHAPFDHPDWIFELRYDGFRALAYIDNGQCRLVSRRGTAYKSFSNLCSAIASAIPQAVLDGEIVHLGSDGKPRLYDLMRRRLPSISFGSTGKTSGDDVGQDSRTAATVRRSSEGFL
jgi:ATP-dependent DNA ligase